MIILDTNVLSELQKRQPDPHVVSWIDAQEPGNLYLTTITAEELLFGVFCLPGGKRRQHLHRAMTAILEEDFQGRILPYDLPAARHYGPRVAEARGNGVVVGHGDGQIAAIAMANHHAPVATRDRDPFVALGVDVINPWDYDLT